MSKTTDQTPHTLKIHATVAKDDIQLSLLVYDFYLQQTRHENDLINHRSTWFLAINSLLVVGVGYIFLGGFSHLFEVMNGHLVFLPKMAKAIPFLTSWLVISLAGLLTSNVAKNSIDAATSTHVKLNVDWSEYKSKVKDQETLIYINALPPLRGGGVEENKEKGQQFATSMNYMSLVFWGFNIIVGLFVVVVGAVV